MKALLTGATGLIGRALVRQLTNAVVLSRDRDHAVTRLPGVRAHTWNPSSGPPLASVFDGVEAVVNLAGEPVARGRWTAERKRRISDSRVLGTQNLVAALARLERRPRVLVSASAVGYYGDRGDDVLDEMAGPGSGYLSDVCSTWEREALVAQELGMRVVCVRIGVVLSPDGGALGKMQTAFRIGAGGRLGNGRQWMPWIHVDDVVGILLHAIEHTDVRGPLNAVSPQPVTNDQFAKALGRAMHRPVLLPVPKAALRLAFGEMSELFTASQRVLPKAAERTGYTFKHPELAEALAAILSVAAASEAA